jgi:hypothetical protein
VHITGGEFENAQGVLAEDLARDEFKPDRMYAVNVAGEQKYVRGADIDSFEQLDVDIGTVHPLMIQYTIS